MMGRRSYQRDLLDLPPEVAEKIDPDSIYHILRRLGPKLLRDEDYAEMYDQRDGRPSHAPSLLAGICILQSYCDVSDREAVERLCFDIRWQWALRLPIDYPAIPHSNLSHFRARLHAHEMEGWTHRRLLELAEEAGLIDLEAPQAIDSTHIFGAAAVQDSYELMQDSLRKLLEAMQEVDGEAATQLIEAYELEERLSAEKPDIDWSDEDERRQWLGRIVKDARALLAALDGHQLAGTEEVQEAAGLLTQILQQDITAPEEEGSEGPAITQGVATDRVVSTVDPEMRHGRKSSATRFDGYKVHISEEVESELITGVAITPGNAHDGPVAAELAEQVTEQFGQAPKVVLGDSHYGSPDRRIELEEAGVEEVVAKLPPTPHREGKFSKEDFEIDLEEESVTCPAGHTTRHKTKSKDHKGRRTWTYQFPAEVCRECPMRAKCTDAEGGRTIGLHYHEEILQETRAYNETEEFEDRYGKRTAVERKLWELCRRHGLRFGRYIGPEKTRLQALWAVVAVNLKKAGRKLADHLAEETLPHGVPA